MAEAAKEPRRPTVEEVPAIDPDPAAPSADATTHSRRDPSPRRIDALMAASLAYIMWFVGIPLAHALAKL